MYCPKCGNRVSENDSFCQRCGCRLNIGEPKNGKAGRPDLGRKPADRRPVRPKMSKTPFIIAGICAAAAAVVFFLFAAPAFIPFFMPEDKINQKTFEIYDEFDMGLAEASIPYYNEEGFIDHEDVPALLDAVESELKKGIESGVISSYSREDENRCIDITYTSGIREIYIPEEQDILVGHGDAKITTVEPTASHFTTKVLEILTNVTEVVIKLTVDSNMPYIGKVWPSDCAVMMAKAYPDEYSYNLLAEVERDRNEMMADFRPDTLSSGYTGAFSGEYADLDLINHLDESKIVIWEGHGAYTNKLHSMLVTGQAKSWTDFEKYKEDMQEERLILTNRSLSLEYIAGVINGSGLSRYYAVTSKYIDKYVGDMDGALLFLGTCFSIKDDTLAQSFINKGADVVYGYTESTGMAYEMGTRAYVQYGLASGLSAGEALDFSVSWWGNTDTTSPYGAQLTARYSDDSMADAFHMSGNVADDAARGIDGDNDSEDGDNDEHAVSITSAEDLDKIRNDLSGSYILDADIDLFGYDWQPVGTTDDPFTGKFDGNGHVISSMVVNIYSPQSESGGFFGVVSGGEVSDLWLKDINVVVHTDGTELLFSNAGGLSGQLYGANIHGCAVTGSVTSMGSDKAYARAGGIAGGISDDTNITDCFVDAYVTADANAANSMAGGVSGWLQNSQVSNTYVSGSVGSYNTDSYAYAGGISASGENSYINLSVVMLDELNCRGTTSLSHPVDMFAAVNDSYISEYTQGEYTSEENVQYVSYDDSLSTDFYEGLGWDTYNIWDITADGVFLKRFAY